MPLRVIDNTDRCMQRLGFLKYIVYKCSLQDSIGINDLGKDLIAKVSKKYPVPLTFEIKEYITKRLTDSVYKPLRDSVKNTEIKENTDQKFLIELQDILLSAEKLPSKTGKLISKDWQRYPYLASSLGLLRKGSYSLLVRGNVFLKFIEKSEIDEFINNSFINNPMFISTEQSIVLLFSYFENDGFILKKLYEKLITMNTTFSDRQAGDILPETYRNIAKLYSSKAMTGEEKDRLQRMLTSADTIERWKDRAYSGKGAREEAITVRVEPFVDLGLLSKKDPYRYEYYINEKGKQFFQILSDCNDVDDFLNNNFFKAVAKAYKPLASIASDKEILVSLYNAYNKIKSTLGYAPIKEISLMAAIDLIFDKKLYFEIGQATQFISKYQKENPYDLRFQVDRSGAPVYVKFLKAIDA